MPPRIIVLGCGLNALGIVHELSRYGYPCIIVDSARRAAGHTWKARFVRCPDISSEQAQFESFLLELCERTPDNPIIFPTKDNFALALARLQARLSAVARPCVAPASAVELLLDKSAFYRLGEQRHYGTPKTFSLDQLKELPPENFPVIAKPNRRQFVGDDKRWIAVERLLNDHRFTVLESSAAVSAFLDRLGCHSEHFLFQEYIPGDCDRMYTVGVYSSPTRGLVGLFAGHKVRGYPPSHGDCAFGENCSLPAEVLQLVRRITAELELCGILEFEFKKELQSGHFRLIEINPRSWSWIGITPRCNVSLPKIAVDDLSGIPVHYSDNLGLGPGSVCFAFLFEEIAGRLATPGKPFGLTLRSLIGHYVRARPTIAEFESWDFPVTLAAAAAAIRRALRTRLNPTVR